MGNCDNECWCVIEGSQGLETDGTGAEDDPFNVHPAAAYSLCYGAATAGTLPAGVDGQFAWLADTDLAKVHRASGWTDVAPEWRSVFIGTVDFDAPPAAFSSSANFVDLSPGWWFLAVSGYYAGSMGNPPGGGSPSLSVWSITYDVLLKNDTTGDTLCNQQARFWTRTLTTDGGTELYFNDPFLVPFCLTSPVHVLDSGGEHMTIYCSRDADVGDNVSALCKNLTAIRLTDHDYYG